jgi:hypothetical protein
MLQLAAAVGRSEAWNHQSVHAVPPSQQSVTVACGFHPPSIQQTNKQSPSAQIKTVWAAEKSHYGVLCMEFHFKAFLK